MLKHILIAISVLPHMRILSHTLLEMICCDSNFYLFLDQNSLKTGKSLLPQQIIFNSVRVWDIPYAYGTILCPIHVWASHMSMNA